MKFFFINILFVLLSACALEGANVIGPAGGFVFYDKGNYNDGWRYLEASPIDAGSVGYSFLLGEVTGTSASIGMGKQNTDIILALINANEDDNGVGNAAKLCSEFHFGGYNDWFLPSENELEQMIKTAKYSFEERNKKNIYLTSTLYRRSESEGVVRSYFRIVNTEQSSGSAQIRPARRF